MWSEHVVDTMQREKLSPEKERAILREQVFGDHACYSVENVRRLEELENLLGEGESGSR